MAIPFNSKTSSDFLGNIVLPYCANCLNVMEIGSLDGTGWTCMAYPNGISPDIIRGRLVHDHKFDDQDTSFIFDGKIAYHDGKMVEATITGAWEYVDDEEEIQEEK